MIYKMTLKDSVDTMTFNLLETPIVDKDIEGAVDNVTLDGNQYTDYLYLKKQYIQKWAIMCPDEYDELRGFYTRQFEEGEVPSYRVYYGANVTRDYTFNGDYFQFNAEGIETGMTLTQITGNVGQETTTGKNLLNYGQLSYSFLANANTRTVVGSIDLTAGTTYYFTYDVQTATSTSQRNTPYLEINGTQYYENTSSNYNKTTGRKTWQYVAQTTGTYTFGYWCHTPNVAVSIANFMASTSSDSTFEPYTAGASPNPSYPQPISTVTGAQTVVVTGKNLLDTSDPHDKSGSGMTATWNNGVVEVKGTNTATSFPLSDNIALPTQIKAGTEISASFVGASTGNTVFRFYNQATSQYESLSVATPNTSGTYTLTRDADAVQLYKGGVQTNTYKEFSISNWQIEYGSTATAYEPYHGQSYEINLGKNLWGGFASGFNFNSGGISGYTNNADGTISIPAGTTTATSYSCDLATATSNNRFITLKAGSYAVSGGTSDAVLQVVTSNNALLGTSFTITSDTKVFIRTRISSGVTMTATTIKPQIEAGSVATSYSPYFTPIELAKVGNYQDRIYKDEGKWYIEKQVGKVVLDGTEDWKIAVTGTVNFYYNLQNMGLSFVGNNHTISNLATNATPAISNSNTNQGMTFYPTVAGGQLRIRYGTEMSIPDWKALLATTNMYYYYALATPTTTEITDDTLLSQLNFLASLYKRENNISLMGTGAQGEMEVFIRDVMSVETDVVPEVPVRLTLTDDGVINACGCRRNVQLTMRETTE